MEKDRQSVELAEVGDEVELTAEEKVKEVTRVYLVKESSMVWT